ncbi:5-oxoprolinase subunit PxpB [Pedobacter rhodius]|uniref:5-oxoprolinase subunit PxpB n=1 Tax=Pedobacter rhodius TaxID=3004098 RepID=A0ABT4KUM3_9SPHI|nr:5-oxoprolinase subunit PxpB [Pedobacter sp. SJ11]MCZ4222618.1 5-oxoprolinase subunit PxpB [Pedobacter sp. SJ11]
MSNSIPNPEFKIHALSEQAVTLSFGNEISESIATKISNFNKLLNNQPFQGFITTVPAYSTLTVYYDLLTVLYSELRGASSFEKVSNYLNNLKNAAENAFSSAINRIILPVYYGGDFGPDIDNVSNFTKLGVQEIIALHSTAVYKVYMIGFVPGFAYLGGMDEQLATPRKSTPRLVVPAGAVGIAGKQTGIYPLETPGGWQIIGQTPSKLFDAGRLQPSLLKAGDEVKFESISLDEFYKLAGKP